VCLLLWAARRHTECAYYIQNTLAHTGEFAGDEGHPHAATLDLIAPTVDPRTGTVRFRAAVPNPKGLFLPGMSARVRLTPALK
jgi:multidrug efflux pump subunit AcrA (membrane-fusion protein)